MAGLWSTEAYRKYMGDKASDDAYSSGAEGLSGRDLRKYQRQQDKATRTSEGFKDWRKQKMRYSGDPTYDSEGNKQYEWSMGQKDWRQAKREGGDFANWGANQSGGSGDSGSSGGSDSGPGPGAPDNSEADANAQDQILSYKDKGEQEAEKGKTQSAIDPRQARKDAITRRKESNTLTRLRSRMN